MNERPIDHPTYLKKNKPKWYEPKEYRRIRAAYSIDFSQQKPLDKIELAEKNERYFAKQKVKRIQYI